ncbi:hypothetical protein D915_008076 [Fasciola hepatica]|uniref:EGF-like domain-containing protein n=1 Tax=Fasciola hepatica TaxID=6192 RepID=A0A4E0RUU9_FASHE|nr:hypothetical protein D915_008076 [Fasciola hepatica]
MSTQVLLLFFSLTVSLQAKSFTRPWDTVPGTISAEDYKNFETNAYKPKQDRSELPESFQRRLEQACSTEQQTSCQSYDCKMNSLSGRLVDADAAESTVNMAPYRCECGNDTLQDYVEGNKIHARCVAVKHCDICDPEHTVKCLDLGAGKISCICDPGYMEDANCRRKKDGCAEPHTTASLSGDEACRVTQGNMCIPMFQSLRYSCVCRAPYMEDKRLSFPNCMGNETVCERPLCLGFQPPVSETIPGPSIIIDPFSEGFASGHVSECNQTSCHCPDGWLGEHCSEQRGEVVLGSWSPWSTCNPDCIMPTQRSEYRILDDVHAGTSRTTGIGYRSRFGRCTMGDFDFCVGTYRFWRRCRVTSLCNSWTNSRLSSVVNDAIGKAMAEHDRAHRPDQVEPILTTAAELTWTEQLCLNFVTVAGTVIYSCISIWILEIHHMIMFWTKPLRSG